MLVVNFHTQPTSSRSKIARAKVVKGEFIKRAEHHAKGGRKVADVLADGVIVGVGLIERGKGDSAEAK